MSPLPYIKRAFDWVGHLGVQCFRYVSIERAARLSPDWGRLESKVDALHRK